MSDLQAPEDAGPPSRRRLVSVLARGIAAMGLIAGTPFALLAAGGITSIPFIEQAVLGTAWFLGWLVAAPASVSLKPALAIAAIGAALTGSAYALWEPGSVSLFVWSANAAAQLSCHGGNLLVLGMLAVVSGAVRR